MQIYMLSIANNNFLIKTNDNLKKIKLINII